MSMLDSFFAKGFKASKCKTLLKLTILRIKLLRNRREIQIRQMRRDIAKLFESGQEATDRIRVEHIIREEKMMAAQETLELYHELIAVRLPIIEAQRCSTHALPSSIRPSNGLQRLRLLNLEFELLALCDRDCPLVLKVAISSVFFSAPRCADLPELLQVQISFASKWKGICPPVNRVVISSSTFS